MEVKTTFGGRIRQALEFPFKFLANGGHAQQDIPSQHRLLNAGGMFLGWLALDQIRQVVFGLKMKSEGEYVEIPLEDISPPLRFLHKAIDWNPHSEAPEHQWKKLAYQLFPGVGAGVGAVLGSMYAFERNGRAQTFKAQNLKGIEKLNLLDLDFQAQYNQSKTLRALSGFFGTFSAASGLTFLYGFFLNPAFASANGAKIFAGLARGNAAPHKAAAAELGMVGSYVEEALKTGKLREDWAKQFELRVLQPLFGHELNTPELQAKAVKTLQNIVEESYHRFKLNGKPAKEIAKAVTEDLSKKLGNSGLDKTLRERFGLDPKNAVVGNANPIIRMFNDGLSAIGLGTRYKYGKAAQSASLGEHALPLLGVGAAIAGGAALAHSYGERVSDTLPAKVRADSDNPNAQGEKHTPGEDSQNKSANKEELSFEKHQTPDASGKTVAEYVKAAVELHSANYKGRPPGWLRWLGDAQLAVLPTNRMYCAIGLTLGQIIGGNMAKIASGFSIDGAPVDAKKVPTYLQWMKGIIKDYNPKGLRPRDRMVQYAQWTIFSVAGLFGVKIATDLAYRNVKEKNKDPHYLEDYLPRISMHQGENWSWLAAGSAIFGSAAGLWTVPFPGTNYGIGLAGRATSMQDRNFMLGETIGGALSGATTTSFLRLREGVNYLCHYAVNNPAETPAQIEFIAYTILGPLFRDQLTIEHIQRFTRAVHEVRDQYWQEGGIPKEKRKEAMQNMREVFTGAGLEVLLIDLGLNPGAIAFDHLNGITGMIGNVGKSKKINKEQENYHTALVGRLDRYLAEGLITQDQENWVKAGIEALKNGKKAPPPEEKAPETVPETAPQQPDYQDTNQQLAANERSEINENNFAIKEEAKKPHRKEKPVKKDNIKDLIIKSNESGDWRQKANLAEEHLAPAVIGA